MRALMVAGLVLLAPGCAKLDRGGPAFALTVSPGQARLLPSGSVTATVEITSLEGYAGPVDLAAEGLGGDLAVAFQPARVTLPAQGSIRAALTVRAADTAPAAQRILRILGRGADEEHAVELKLEIPAATVFPVTTFQGETPANLPFLAYQDGDGPWTALEGQGGAYKLPVTNPAGRFAVVYGSICRIGDFTSWDVNAFHLTLRDTQALFVAFFCNPGPGPQPTLFDLGGALRGTAGQPGLISASTGLWSFEGGAPRYDLKVYKGLGDLVAGTYPDPDTYIPSRLIVERGRDAQAPATRDLDFAAEGAAPLPRQPIARPALAPGEAFRAGVQYQTGRGQVAILGNGADLAEYAPFPPALGRTGDATLYGFQASGPDTVRTVYGSTPAQPGPLTPRLPSLPPPFTVSAAGTARLRLCLAWEAVTPRPESHTASLVQRTEREEAYWYVSFSRAWLGEGTRFTWTPPDLSAVPGFEPGFLFRPGVGVQVQMSQGGSQTVPEGFQGLLARLAAPARNLPAAEASRPGDRPHTGPFRVRRVPRAEAAAASLESFYASRILNFVP
jgi:hypothetical protein